MRKSAHRPITLTSILLSLALCWGCGTAVDAPTETIAIKGKITYKGQPVTQGVVTFEPRDSGRAATGTVQADGTFVLTTYKEGDGVVVGRHKVSVSGTGTKSNREFMPVKYTSPNTSGLEADVSRDKTEFTFDLK
jgi:hypothetical protein